MTAAIWYQLHCVTSAVLLTTPFHLILMDDLEKQFQQYLSPNILVSLNNRKLEERIPLVNIELTADFLYDKVISLYKRYTNIATVQIQLAFYLKDRVTNERRLFYASTNTNIMDRPAHMPIYKHSPSESFKFIKARLDEAESHGFRTSTMDSYAKNSSESKAIPCLCVIKCNLSNQ